MHVIIGDTWKVYLTQCWTWYICHEEDTAKILSRGIGKDVGVFTENSDRISLVTVYCTLATCQALYEAV